MGKVYVTMQTPHDLAPAQDFGELVYLLKQAKDQTFAPQPVLRQLKHGLEKYTSQDYILLVGDPIAMALAVNAAALANNGHVKLLKWSKRYNRYYPVEIDLYDRNPNQGEHHA